MKISHRLIGLSLAGILGTVSVGTVGLYGVRAVQERFETLSGRTSPLNSALLELQRTQERTLVELLGLAAAEDEDTAAVAREAVRVELASLSATATRIEALDGARTVDAKAFVDALADLEDMVAERLGGTALYRTAAETARRALQDVDDRVGEVGDGVGRIVDAANAAAAESQLEADRLGVVQRRAQRTQGLLNDLTVMVYATDALSSKFRLGPLQERFIAAIDALGRELEASEAGGPLRAALPGTEALRTAFTDETNGLFALRTAMLEDDRDARRAYRSARTEAVRVIDESAAALDLLVDDLLFTIAAERRAIEAALALVGDPASVTGVSRRLALRAKGLGVEVERLLLARDAAELEAAHDATDATLDALTGLAARLAAGLEGLGRDDLQRAADGVGEALERTRASIASAYEGVGRGLASGRDMTRSLSELKEIAGARREIGARDVAEIAAAMDAATAEVDRQVDTATGLIVGLSAAAALLSLAVGLITIRSIIGRLHRALAVADTVSRGRLDPVVTGGGNDEIARLMGALGRMVATLDGSVRQIRSATLRVTAGAEQISSGNGDLSDRTEQQANRLGETAGTTARIGEIVREGARATARADELSRTASDVAGRGRHAVHEAMNSMTSIKAGAREISSISEVIDAIAFQTNILALNAAVEASRAGESGRGFAVVAAEVGSLARESKEAVLRIREIVDKNVAHVESGSTLVGEAERHMEEVVDKVDQVAGLIETVSASARRQVEEIGQIDSSVGNLGQMTRQNAELSDRTSGAARDLLEQSRALDASVSAFVLPETRAANDEAVPRRAA